jgi:hypothetical protein
MDSIILGGYSYDVCNKVVRCYLATNRPPPVATAFVGMRAILCGWACRLDEGRVCSMYDAAFQCAMCISYWVGGACRPLRGRADPATNRPAAVATSPLGMCALYDVTNM